jgi:hypothetical protein
MKSILTGVIGALVGVFLCALVGVNFSKGIESIADVPEDTSVQSQSSENWPSQQQVQDSMTQLNLQRLQSELSFCQGNLAMARLNAQMEKMKISR